MSNPISDNLLASSELFTPQLGATFCSQRLWMFILQPEQIHTTQMTTTIFDYEAPMYSIKSSKYVLTLAVKTLFYQAIKERSAVVTVCGNFVVVLSELVG